jgi:hypothetical protein
VRCGAVVSNASRKRHLAAGMCGKGCGRPRRDGKGECEECALKYARNLRRQRYGLSVAEFEALESVTSCQACGVNLEKGRTRKSHAIDHCHSTGAVRGVLCIGCNAVLGFVADDAGRLRSIIGYIEGWQKRAA